MLNLFRRIFCKKVTKEPKNTKEKKIETSFDKRTFKTYNSKINLGSNI